MVTDQPRMWQLNLDAPWRDLGDERVLDAVRIFESYLPRGERLRQVDLTPGSSTRHIIRRVWSKRRVLGRVRVDDYEIAQCVLETGEGPHTSVLLPGGEEKPHAAIWLKSRLHRALELSAWGNFQPLLSAAQLRELLARLGMAIGAHRGKVEMFFPHRDERVNAHPYKHRMGWLDCPWPPSEGFPRFWGFTKEGGPGTGASIEWINYWNREICALTGFPPADRGACFGAWPLPDESGGWVWQLTEDPIDWLRRDHRMQYKRALLAMPFVGGRDPRWPKPPQRQLGAHYMEFHLACPPRGPASEDDRPLRLVETVERLYYDDIAAGDTAPFPFEFFYECELYRRAPKPPGMDRIPDRAAWLALPHDGDIPTLTNAGGLASHYLQGRHFDHPPPGYLYVRIFLQIVFPRAPTLAARKPDMILETCARVMNAYWGRALFTGSREVSDAQVDAGDPRDVHPEGLPILRPPWEMPDVHMPAALGQVNYWSAETCRRIGFPPGGDPSVMAYAREVEGGGWIWGVMRDTLWLRYLNSDKPALEAEHRAILRRAYERFPAVGGRVHGG